MSGGAERVYHTDEDCRQLCRANTIYEKDLETLTNFRECEICAGEAPKQDDPDRSIYKRIADPDTTLDDLL